MLAQLSSGCTTRRRSSLYVGFQAALECGGEDMISKMLLPDQLSLQWQTSSATALPRTSWQSVSER